MPAWVLPAVMAGGGAIAGKSSADQANRQRRQEQKMNEIEARYSNWLDPRYRQVSRGASALGSTLGGAMMGGMQGANMQNTMGLFSEGTGAANGAFGKSYLGGKGMADELGAEFNPGIQKMSAQINSVPSKFAAPTSMSVPSTEVMLSDDLINMESAPATLDTNMLTPNPEVFPEGYVAPNYNQGGILRQPMSRYSPRRTQFGFSL